MKKTILTGVKPTGTPHIGNYLGAIKPAIDLMNIEDADCLYFIADYHALNQIHDAKLLKQYTLEVASTWLACGLDPERVLFYKQSSIPEIFEIYAIISNVTPKGLLNRAHAYKAKVDENRASGNDDDFGINMGLYNYPVLMAADILAFNSTHVPVGLDQKQHVEITRDIAGYFNKRYGKTFVETAPIINNDVAIIYGIDGRKMSKSYGNTIELFLEPEQLRKKINRIVTDSKGIDEPKDTNNAVFNLYKLFATKEETEKLKQDLEKGIAWSEAKTRLFEAMNNFLTPMREKYKYYMAHPEVVEEILNKGSKKAREIAKSTLNLVRKQMLID